MQNPIQQAKLYHKSLYGFGDSLVAGHSNRIGMLSEVATVNEMLFTNYSINGATILPKEPYELPDSPLHEIVYDIAMQIRRASEKAPDYICFDGLTNDACEEACKIPGRISDSFDAPLDDQTFAGAFETVCKLLKEKYPGSAILYVCPHRMPSRTADSQHILQKTARQACLKWSIPYVDMYHDEAINTCIDKLRIRYSYNSLDCMTGGNGTHLNEDGYRNFYAPRIAKALAEIR